jgi:dipeptidyl aminopeptidase/acylaminoacyl peptidase
VLVSDRGTSLPWRFRFDPDSGVAVGDPAPIVATDTQAACVTLGVSPDAPRGPLVSVISTLDAEPPELRTAVLHGQGEGLRTETSLGSEWRRGLAWPSVRRLSAPGPGGAIDVWVCSPADGGDAPLPTVVHIHGGPLGAWTGTPSMDDLILCSAGYRVLLPNIRGSATYGQGWIRPQLGDWGGVDAADVLAAVDHAVALGLADPGRLGLLGLSYGGFMVNWLVGTSDRFRGAVSENGVANQISDWANSDVGVEYDRVALLGDVFSEEGVRKLWRQSPLRHVTSIRTPLLMLQAEADLRCPPADNEQLFIALRVLGREVEYVLYPEESHVYSVTGRPDRRVDRMARMLDWFDRHLKGKGAA